MSLNATVEARKAEKYDAALEQKLRSWMGELLPAFKASCNDSSIKLDTLLKDGVILLSLLDVIVPGKAPKPSKMNIAFKQMENIQNYLKACETAVGMQQTELFETLDLYEARNLPVVLAHLAVLKFVSEKYLANKEQATSSSSPKAKPKVLAGSPVEKKTAPAPMNSDLFHKKRDITSSSGGSASPTGGAKPAKSGADVTSLADDVATKEEFKFDSEVATAVKKWLEESLSITITDLINGIKSGVVLCQLLNKIKPNTVAKIYEGGVAYLQMENVGRYIKGCLEIGMTPTEMFETNDLVNEKNLSMVLSHLYSLATFVQRKPELNWKGPQIAAVQSRSLFAATLIGGELSDEPISVAPLTPDQQTLMDWANFNIMKSGRVDMTLSNLSADTRTSVKLIILIEQLLGTPSGVPFNRNPTHMWHAMQNASLMLRYLSSQTFEKVDGVRAADIVLGNVNASCRLLTYLRDKFDLDFMFKGLLGPDIDTTAAGLGDLEDDVVEIELEEGEAVPEYLRTFIAAEDLAEIDEANRRAASSPRTSELPSSSTVETPSHAQPEPAPPVAEEPRPVEHKPSPRRPSTSQPVHTTPWVKEPQPVVEPAKPATPEKVEPVKQASPRRPSNPATPTKTTTDDKQTHLHVATTSPRPKDTQPETKLTPFTQAPSTPTHAPVEPAPQPVEPKPVPEPTQPEKTPDNPAVKPEDSKPAESPAEQTPAASEERPSSPSKSKSKAKIDAKINISLTASRPRSGKTTSIPLPANSPRGDKRKVKVYKNQVQAEAQSQPATRDRSGSVSLTADQQKRVADAQATVRMRVAQELLSTERNYVKSLKTLVSGLIEKARKESILTSSEISQCFSNIEEIAQTNARLEAELTQAVEVRKDTSGLPALFKSFVPDMQKAYEPFISNYNNCMVALQILRLKNPKLVTLQQQFEEECMKSTMYNVESFVIMPVQRIPRYLLLLKDILKYTPKESAEATAMSDAIDDIDKMLKDLNSKIDREAVEHLRRQLVIAQSIEQAIDIFSVKRKYVGEASLPVKRYKVVDSKKADDNKKRKAGMKKVDYFYFMSDILLMCSHLNAKSEDQKQFSHVETFSSSGFVIAASENSLASAGLSAKTVFKNEKKHKDCQFVLIRLVENSPVEWWLLECKSPLDRDALFHVLEGNITIAPY